MVTRPRIRDLHTSTLRWTQPRTLAREFQLQADQETVGTLNFSSMFGSLARAESGDGCWTFKRRGFIATQVTIRTCDSSDDLALFRNNTWASGGTLELADGRRYRANSNFWQTRYDIQTSEATPLVTFDRVGGLLHLSSTVIVHEPARSLRELPWLIMLGWYLTVMQHGDSAAAAVS